MVKVLKKETIKKRVIDDMRSLGVYKNEYRDMIETYVDICHDYLVARKDFEDSGRQYETQTAAGNPKKSAIVDTIEKLRKDKLAYSDRLGLSPKSFETLTVDGKKVSKLASLLSGHE